MTKQITLEQALELVRFKYYDCLGWQVFDVPGRVHGDVLEVEGNVFNGVGGNVHGKVGGDVVGDVKGYVDGSIGGIVKGDVIGGVGGDVDGDIHGDVSGDVVGNIYGDVVGNIYGDVSGSVKGKINGRKWESVETPKDKLQRLITESGNQELIDTFNQLEDN